MKRRRTKLSRIAHQLDARFEQLELAHRAQALASQELIGLAQTKLDNGQLALSYLLDALEDLETNATAPKAAAILKDAVAVGWGCTRTVPSGKVDVLQAEVVGVEPTADPQQDRVIARVLRPAVYLNHRAQPVLLRSARVSVFAFNPDPHATP